VRVKAYEHREGASTARVERQLTAEAPLRCPTCGGGGYKLEHSDTGFKTLEEAIPHVARLNGVKQVEN
jgi:hypothetical protein